MSTDALSLQRSLHTDEAPKADQNELAKRDDNRCPPSHMGRAKFAKGAAIIEGTHKLTSSESRKPSTGRENIKNAWFNPPALVIPFFPSNEVLARNAHHNSRTADTSR